MRDRTVFALDCRNSPDCGQAGLPAEELSEIHAAPARTLTKLVFQQVDKEQHGGREDSREFPDCCLQILARYHSIPRCHHLFVLP